MGFKGMASSFFFCSSSMKISVVKSNNDEPYLLIDFRTVCLI